MKKCAECGHENIDDAKFCGECGLELDSASSSSKKEDSNSNSKKEDSTPSNSKKEDSSVKSIISNIRFDGYRRAYNKSPACFVCCIIPILIFAMFVMADDVHDFIKESHAEDYNTNYPEEFNNLDINKDGKLEFNEVNNIVSHTPQEKLYDIFEKSDKNDNGYLIAYEYDIFRAKARGNYYEAEYRKSLEEQEKKRNASKNSASSYKGSSNNKHSHDLNNQEFDRSEGYVLTCPYCGSEAIYETGGYYKCADCGSSIYSADDLELAYGEGQME